MEPGIHNIPASKYHADPCPEPSLSNSMIALLANSPLHAWTGHRRLNPNYHEPPEDKFDQGIAQHSVLLEDGEAIAVLDFNDFRTKAAREARDAARDEGKVPILAKKMSTVRKIAMECRRQIALHEESDMFQNGKAEQALIWREQGVWCRARCDWLHDSLDKIDDYKTTEGSANPESFSRKIADLGHDTQAAFYLRGLRAITGNEGLFRFCVQETKNEPYAISVVACAPDVLNLANAKIDAAIKTWKTCLEKDEWPGYPAKLCYANLNPWDEARWLESQPPAKRDPNQPKVWD